MTIPATTPASTPTRTHVTNIVKLMTPPPSSPRYDSSASLPPHHCTRSASSPCAPVGPFAPAGWTRAQAVLTGGGGGRAPLRLVCLQNGRAPFRLPVGLGRRGELRPRRGGRQAPAPPRGRGP